MVKRKSTDSLIKSADSVIKSSDSVIKSNYSPISNQISQRIIPSVLSTVRAKSQYHHFDIGTFLLTILTFKYKCYIVFKLNYCKNLLKTINCL